jgi:hypothetical protein
MRYLNRVYSLRCARGRAITYESDQIQEARCGPRGSVYAFLAGRKDA